MPRGHKAPGKGCSGGKEEQKREREKIERIMTGGAASARP